MEAIIYVVILLIIMIVLYFINTFRRFDELRIRIIEAEENIDLFLDNKAKLMLDLCNTINDINKKKVFTGLSFLKKNNYDSFRLDRELNELDITLKEYLVMTKSFVPDDETTAKLNELELNEIELDGSKIFYNDNSKIFNKMIDKFPSSLVARKKQYDYKYLYTFEKEEFFKIMTKDKKKNK